jgi:hypothetical protein
MQNPVLEGRRKMEELFEKIEFILCENFEVISKLLVPIEKKENS